MVWSLSKMWLCLVHKGKISKAGHVKWILIQYAHFYPQLSWVPLFILSFEYNHSSLWLWSTQLLPCLMMFLFHLSHQITYIASRRQASVSREVNCCYRQNCRIVYGRKMNSLFTEGSKHKISHIILLTCTQKYKEIGITISFLLKNRALQTHRSSACTWGLNTCRQALQMKHPVGI